MKSKNQNRKTETKHKTDKRTRAVRIVAWILIIMTVVTTLYTAIYFIMQTVYADDTEKPDIEVAVGILYGSDIDVALTAKTTNGFVIGSEKIEKYDKTFTELWSVENCKKATILCDKNYEKVSGGAYKVTDTPNVGVYRLTAGTEYTTRAKLENDVANVNKALAETEYYAIPAYVNGKYTLYIGGFLTEKDATSAAVKIGELLPEKKLTVKAPSPTGTFAVEHDTKRVLFAYDCGNESYLAFDAINDKDGTEAYLSTFNNNLYDGVFVFKRTVNSSKDGITLITVVPIEQYVMGVIPYEIPASWPIETHRALAIIARTFVLSNIGKHYSQWGFNVCATSNCQVYRGMARVNDSVREAVNSTAGQITTYDGKLATVNYCSNTGNCTADASKVWGGGSKWLSGVATPWEDYMKTNRSKSFWTVEMSPHELCAALNKRGYDELKDEIASVTIDETASDISTYVYSVTITDVHGTSVKVTRCDKVRSAFSDYVYSANFVIGKGSVDYTAYTRTVPPTFAVAASDVSRTTNNIFSVLTGSGVKDVDLTGGAQVLTGGGKLVLAPNGTVSIMTADGKVTVPLEGDAIDDTPYIETQTAKAEDPNDFIIVGKGWGHGVGVSQWGLYDLANMGFDCVSMLCAYCPGISIGEYKKVVNY